MNGKIQHQLDQLDYALHRLRAVLDEKQRIIAEQQDKQEAALKEQWTLKRNIETHKRANADYDALEKVNYQLQARQQQIEQKLRDTMTKVKALSERLRP